MTSYSVEDWEELKKKIRLYILEGLSVKDVIKKMSGVDESIVRNLYNNLKTKWTNLGNSP